MKFVFWCSNEQRQFRLAELDAIIHMLGLQVLLLLLLLGYATTLGFCACLGL